MNPALRQRLQALAERHEELTRLLAAPEVLADAARWQALSREHARLAPLAAGMAALHAAERERAQAQALLHDPELAPLAGEDLQRLDAAIVALGSELDLALFPTDPHDEGALYLEIRAGTGGDEAALFAGDLARMYLRLAERHRATHTMLVPVQYQRLMQWPDFDHFLASVDFWFTQKSLTLRCTSESFCR